ncbi:MAG: J domain-containing protein [Alphaproteobacteria bacterium]
MDQTTAGPMPEERLCDWQGCPDIGEHRAPRSPGELNTYLWFCLDHVRTYNKAWNFYEGMSDEEVEADVRRDTTWNRPSWPFAGERKDVRFRATGPDIDDFGAFGHDFGNSQSRPQWPHGPDAPQSKALALFDLTPPLTADDIKGRYKELVKRHHPDTNGGAKKAEEAFKGIVEAYQTLMAEFDD